MKEEDKIKKRFGTDNAFKVPEGYFDNLTNEIMNKLPEKEILTSTEEEVSTWRKIRPWLYMAAMFIAILLPIRFIVNSTSNGKAELTASNKESVPVSDEYIDAIMDHTMMDDYALYQYLTETDTDTSNN